MSCCARMMGLLLAVVLGLWPRMLYAQSPTAHSPSPAADALFEQGRAALAKGDLETACARFRGSDQIDPQPGTRANIGNCEERRGRLASAWEAFRSALQRLPATDSRQAIIKQRVKTLEARLPHLVLELAPGAPADTMVREGTAILGASATFGVPLPLDPGVHRLTVFSMASPPRMLDVRLVEGSTVRVQVGAVHRRQRTPARYGPWVIGGLGVASLVAASVSGSILLYQKGVASAHCSEIPPTCRDEMGMHAARSVRALGPVTTSTLVLGGVGVAAGALWLGLRPGISVSVEPASAGAMWRVEGSW